MSTSRTPATWYMNGPALPEAPAIPSATSQPNASTLLPDARKNAELSKPLPPTPVGSPTARRVLAKFNSPLAPPSANTTPASLNTRSSLNKPLRVNLDKPLPEKPLPALPNPLKSTLNRFRVKVQANKVASAPNKTVLDLVSLNTRSSLNKPLRVNLDKPLPEKPLPALPKTVLDLVKTTNSRGEQDVPRKEMIQILSNTVERYKLPEGSSAKNKIDQYINELNNELKLKRWPGFFKLDKQKLSSMVRTIGEEIHKNQHALNPQLAKTSDARREAARMPTECMVHWMSVTEAYASNTSDPTQRQALQNLLTTAKDRWEDRRLTFQDTREFFEYATEQCTQYALRHLADLAKQLKAEMPGPEHDNFDVNKEDLKYKTRLHANDYGRVYSSAFAEALAKDPPPSVKAAIFQLGNALAEYYLMPKEMNDADKARYGPIHQQHIEQIQASLIKDQRSWTNQSPLFTAFVNEKDPAKKADAFEKLLRSSKETGVDCMIIPYIAIKTFVSWPSATPNWMVNANDNYANVIRPQNPRLDNQSDVVNMMDSHRRKVINDMKTKGRTAKKIYAVSMKYLNEITSARETVNKSLLKTADAGATLSFQPAAIHEPGMDTAVRPPHIYRPDFSHLPEELDEKSGIVTTVPDSENKLQNILPQAVQQSLSHGIPFTGGISGTTNLIMHFVAYVNRQGKNINAKDTLVAVIMNTCYNGGHVPDDCLATAKLLDGDGPGKLKLNLGLSDPSDADAEYVTSLKKLFSSPGQNSGDSDPIKNASEKAFEKTLEYFRENSHYARK